MAMRRYQTILHYYLVNLTNVEQESSLDIDNMEPTIIWSLTRYVEFSSRHQDAPSGVGSNLQMGGTMPAAENFLMCPPLFSCAPPHEGAQRLFVTD